MPGKTSGESLWETGRHGYLAGGLIMETGIWFAVIAFLLYFTGFIVSRKNKDWSEFPCLCLAVVYLGLIIAQIIKLARSMP